MTSLCSYSLRRGAARRLHDCGEADLIPGRRLYACPRSGGLPRSIPCQIRHAECSPKDADPVQIDRSMQVRTKSVYQWRRAWRAGRQEALASRGRAEAGAGWRNDSSRSCAPRWRSATARQESPPRFMAFIGGKSWTLARTADSGPQRSASPGIGTRLGPRCVPRSPRVAERTRHFSTSSSMPVSRAGSNRLPRRGEQRSDQRAGQPPGRRCRSAGTASRT